MGINVGNEQDGTGKNFDRPIVIVKGFNSEIFLALPLTGSKKEGKYYFYLGQISDREATAVLSQIRLIDTKRLIRKIGTLNELTFMKLKNALKASIFE